MKNGNEQGMDMNRLIENLKIWFRKGNTHRIALKKGEREILTLPVNLWLVLALIGLSHPWILLGVVIAGLAAGMRLDWISENGQVRELLSKEKLSRVIHSRPGSSESK